MDITNNTIILKNTEIIIYADKESQFILDSLFNKPITLFFKQKSSKGSSVLRRVESLKQFYKLKLKIDDEISKYVLLYGYLSILPESILNKSKFIDERSSTLEYINDLDLKITRIRDLLPGIELRNDQVESIKRIAKKRIGCIQIGTGGGKTEIAIGLLKLLEKLNGRVPKTLILTPTNSVCLEFRSRLLKYGFDPETTIMVNEHDKDHIGLVNVCHPASALNRMKLLEDVEVLIIDEAHHSLADTWTTVYAGLHNLAYSVGLSATFINENKLMTKDFKYYLTADEMGMVGPVGLPVISISSKVYRELGILAELECIDIPYYSAPDVAIPNLDLGWSTVVKYLGNKDRAKFISEILKSIYEKDERLKVMLLSDTKVAIRNIAENLDGIPHVCSYGGNKCETYKDGKFENLKFKSKDDYLKFIKFESQLILATSHMDEGSDIDKLDIIVLASGGKNDRRITQRIGRGSRLGKLKNKGYVINVLDPKVSILNKHAHLRREVIKSLGIDVTHRVFSVDDIGRLLL